MEEKIILIYVVLFSGIIHTVENICTEQVITSKEVKHICRYRPDYGSNYCKNEYPVISKTISCVGISINYFTYSHITATEESFQDTATYPIILKVTNSDIPVIETSVFKNYQTLSIIYMENLNIQKIMPGAFNHVDNLKELYLKGNQLTIISDGIFNSLTLLERLDLSGNRIQNISDHAFVGVKLSELYLSNNNISQIGEVLLTSLTTLKTLDVSWNNLNNITRLNNLQSLSTLNLSHNLIEMVDFDFFESYLNEIDLSFNNINKILNFNESRSTKIILNHNNIISFEKNAHLLFLDVSFNELETIDIDLFGVGIKSFYAGNNLLSSINKDAFLNLSILEYLSLNNNNLSSIPNSLFKDLHSLQHLDLSGNKLTSFMFGTFDNLLNLRVLNISHNNLKDLQQYAFHSLGSLTELFFQNNEISEVHVDDLMSVMPRLHTVNFDNNVWSCKKLVAFVLNLRKNNVLFSNGNCWEESNIHGIKCYDIVDRTTLDKRPKSEADSEYSKMNSFFNEDFTKTVMYKYFNNEFKQSNFFKYLETLINNTSNNTENLNVGYLVEQLKELKTNSSVVYNNEFAQSAMYNYFNRDFRNSSFFKYLENFKNKAINENNSDNFRDNKLEEFINSFKQILENNSVLNNLSNQDFSKSNMYKYFNEDFKNSNFFKYLEGLNGRAVAERPESLNKSKTDKFVRTQQDEKTILYIPNYNGLLSFIAILLIVIICTMATGAYLIILTIKKYIVSKKDEVELI